MDYPKKLQAEGFAAPGTLVAYAVGHLVIWMPPDASLNVSRDGWNALLDERVQKIAIANPEHAPYGRAAIAALKNAGIYERVKAKLVYGENISQAAQFVQSGNAQAGILAKSLALSPSLRDGKNWNIPSDLHPTILQGALVLKSAANNANAKAFLEFVKSPSGRVILDACGLAAPTPADLGAGHP
jgi:molybdate transport system substrate-binding protein